MSSLPGHYFTLSRGIRPVTCDQPCLFANKLFLNCNSTTMCVSTFINVWYRCSTGSLKQFFWCVQCKNDAWIEFGHPHYRLGLGIHSVDCGFHIGLHLHNVCIHFCECVPYTQHRMLDVWISFGNSHCGFWIPQPHCGLWIHNHNQLAESSL